jgi:integrase
MLFRRGNTWYIAFKRGGRRIRRSAGTDNKQQAQRKHDELKAHLWKATPQSLTHDLAGAFVLWLTARPRSRNDKNAIKQIRKLYLNRSLAEVTPASIEAVFGDKTPGTYNRLIALIRAALNLAAARGWIDNVPKLARRREAEGRIRFLTYDEWERLRAALPAHLRAMAEFSIATGLRWSNVARLEWSQISIQQGLAWIHPDQAKGGRAIGVPLSTDAQAILRAQMGAHIRYVFVYCGHPIRSPKTAWNKACRRVGLEGLRWHDLRHTWASWHVMNGTPIAVLQKLGGWKSSKMVERYAHFAPDFTASYANNAKPVSLQSTQHKA